MKRNNNYSALDKYIECEIPPFTPYWIGDDDDIGAARIRTIKEV